MRSLFLLSYFFSVVFHACFGRTVLAQEKPLPPIFFVLKHRDGTKYEGCLTEINSKDFVFSDGKRAPFNDVLSLSQKTVPLPPLPHDDHILLTSGDRIPIKDLRLENDVLYFHHPRFSNGNETKMELNQVRMIWRIAPNGSISPEKVRHRLRFDQRNQDVILLRNGDFVEGTLTRIRDGKIEVENQKKLSSLRWNQVSALTLSPELVERTKKTANHVRVILKPSNNEGGRFSLDEWSCINGIVQGKTTFGSTFQAPLEQIAHFDIISNRTVRLDETPAKQTAYEPFLDETFPPLHGCNSLGRDAYMAGSCHDFCIGMHGQSKFEYKLDGNYKFFSTQVGLDDRDGLGGQAEIRIIVDGKSRSLPRSGILTSPRQPLDLHFDVSAAKTLILEVRWHNRASIRSVVNWANPLLIK